MNNCAWVSKMGHPRRDLNVSDRIGSDRFESIELSFPFVPQCSVIDLNKL